MVVTSYEANASAAVGNLRIATPHKCLFGTKALVAVFVPKIDITNDFFRCWNSSGEWMAAIAFFLCRKTHVPVELIKGGDGFGNTVSYRMTFSRCHIGNPVWIH